LTTIGLMITTIGDADADNNAKAVTITQG